MTETPRPVILYIPLMKELGLTWSEIKNMPIARKSIVAKKIIKKGELFSENNLTVKRPGTGMSPMKWDDIMTQKSKKYFNMDDLIEI